MAILDRIKGAWNAFRARDDNRLEVEYTIDTGPSYNFRPDRARLRFYNERSIVAAIYNRIAIDVAGITIKHVALDELGRYSKDVDSELNKCLTLEANIDQAPRAFRQDIVMSLFDSGTVAILPVDTSVNPNTNDVFDIFTLRVGEVTQWYPRHVRINAYNEETGQREEVTVAKRHVAIIENPLYSVMNESNSTLQRLIRKLQILDVVDEQSGSGKLDIIIQMPYTIKSEARRQQAERRREDIEFQLKGSQYGIAYTDATEKIIQLNRPAENNLMSQIEYLINMLYGQLGITDEVMNGTADEKTMLNYFNRTIEPIVDAIIQAMQRAFLSSMGKQKNERIRYFNDPFKLVPLTSIAEIADKFTRNEIFTANEIRGFMGVPPSADPKADKLINSNMPQQEESSGTSPLERNNQNES